MHAFDDDDLDGPGDHDRDLLDAEDREDDEYSRSCPNCGSTVYEAWPKCRQCGIYLDDAGSSTAAARSQGWFWPVMIAVLIALILVIWSGLR